MTNTAIVTGASSGIGADIARELARRQWHVVLVARRAERLDELAASLRAQYKVNTHVLPADLTDEAQRRDVIRLSAAWAEAQGLRLSALVNNAGTGVWNEFADQDEHTLLRDIELNVAAVTSLTHAFTRLALRQGGPAHVLNIASLAGLLPAPRFAVYSATKSYLISFTEVLAQELKGTRVSVTCACPGGVQTEFLALAGQKQISNIGMMHPQDVARLVVNAMLAGKVIYVPGLLNKLSALARHLPSAMRTRLVGKSMALTVSKA